MSSLYIHIPFCEKKCFYCSFVVSVGQRHRVDLYLDCLSDEALYYKGDAIQTVYLGGGTPTFLTNEQLQKIFDVIHNNFKLADDVECTVEANPEGLDIAKIKFLKKLGVNRISLGVQSLNNEYLKYLGRIHDREKAVDAFHIIREGGIENINLDLMYTFPEQSCDELQDDVGAISELGSEHLSLYALSIEPNSRFYVKKEQLPNDQVQVDQYILVCRFLEKAGLKQYEVSNFARPGEESRHNLNYWEGGNYIGLGVGAHSHINGTRSWNVAKLTEYIRRIERKESPLEGNEQLDHHQRLWETMLFGLRMNRGVNVKEKEETFGCKVPDEKQIMLERFVEEGWLQREGDILKTSLKGRLLLDELCARLI